MPTRSDEHDHVSWPGQFVSLVDAVAVIRLLGDGGQVSGSLACKRRFILDSLTELTASVGWTWSQFTVATGQLQLVRSDARQLLLPTAPAPALIAPPACARGWCGSCCWRASRGKKSRTA